MMTSRKRHQFVYVVSTPNFGITLLMNLPRLKERSAKMDCKYIFLQFRHRGMSVQMEKRSTGTTTGVMHHDHLNDSSAHVKRPNVFLKRVEVIIFCSSV